MTTTDNAAVGQKHAPENGYAAPANTGTAHKAVQQKMPNNTTLDALAGWFGLGANVKQSKTRQQKKSWIRKGAR
jgi:hypothetical protein